MPLVGRTLGAVLASLCAHQNRLLATTLTERPLVSFIPEAGIGQITFRDSHGASVAPIQTRFGEVGLFIRQRYATVTLGRNRVALLPDAYGYTITPLGDSQPLLRWEYVREPAGDPPWSRHHLQGPLPATIGVTTLLLNDWHLPTGRVLLEDIIRFCIVDLGAEYQHRTSDWHTMLRDSRVSVLRELAEQDEF